MRATIDFTGTGPVLPGNLNANRAIVTAAVMYCLRCLIQEDIPLNQGVLAPIRLVLPECLLNPPAGPSPELCPAVVGGNVETSQRIVNVILGALGIAAASQGTMNNLLFGRDCPDFCLGKNGTVPFDGTSPFGNGSFGYYETICGGSGATPQADGADAVHTHMTNTRATDPEVLEQRYPVRLWEFSIRRGSGGAGRHRGGDGAVRRIEFLAELEVSLLTQRRGPYAPYGLEGGQPGALGRNILQRADGSTELLPAAVRFTAHPGDVLTLHTPGGGGFERRDEPSRQCIPHTLRAGSRLVPTGPVPVERLIDHYGPNTRTNPLRPRRRPFPCSSRRHSHPSHLQRRLRRPLPDIPANRPPRVLRCVRQSLTVDGQQSHRAKMRVGVSHRCAQEVA